MVLRSKATSETLSASDSVVVGATGFANGASSEIPGSRHETGKINWLGSSYSGADIKVVAHLYGEMEENSEQVRLKDEYILCQDLITAFTTLKSAIPYIVENPTDSELSYLLDRYFSKDLDSRIYGHIYSFVLSFNGGLSKEGRISIMLNAIDGNIAVYKSEANVLNEKIKKLEDLRKESSTVVVLATLQTLSVQSHREKNPVRALGSSNVRGFVRGQRTIAGSMIFTMFNETALADLIRSVGSVGGTRKYGELTYYNGDDISSLLADQLPPLDLTIAFANEYGSLSRATIYGVEFMNSGITLSIEDLLTEEVVQFVARDLDPVMSEGHISLMKDQRGMNFDDNGKELTGSQLVASQFTTEGAYGEYLKKLGVRRRFRGR